MKQSNTHIFLIESRAARAPRGGVARYVREMVKGLHEKYGNQLAVCSGLSEFPSSIRRVNLPLRYPWRYSSKLLYEATNSLEKLLLRNAERRLRPNVIFSPLYGPLATETPQVFTVYDLRLELHPQHFEEKSRALEVEHRRRCFRRANAIISISNATRSDLLHFYPEIDPSTVHVVPLAVSEEFFQPVKCEHALKPYFLFVGNRTGPKNFLRLLEAFATSGLAKNLDLRVISPGFELPSGWSESERTLIHSKGLDKAVRLSVKASEPELISAYSGATGFVFPSEHEGYGLPVLEALAARTIVACSKISSLPEAGGNAAIYFDPSDVNDIAHSLIEIAQMSSTERSRRIAEGQRHVRNLTWSNCVDKTCEILESVAESDAHYNQHP